MQASSYNFQPGAEGIEMVSEYKFLGVLFSYNGRFRKEELELKEQTTRALYPITGISC